MAPESMFVVTRPPHLGPAVVAAGDVVVGVRRLVQSQLMRNDEGGANRENGKNRALSTGMMTLTNLIIVRDDEPHIPRWQ